MTGAATPTTASSPGYTVSRTAVSGPAVAKVPVIGTGLVVGAGRGPGDRVLVQGVDDDSPADHGDQNRIRCLLTPRFKPAAGARPRSDWITRLCLIYPQPNSFQTLSSCPDDEVRTMLLKRHGSAAGS